MRKKYKVFKVIGDGPNKKRATEYAFNSVWRELGKYVYNNSVNNPR